MERGERMNSQMGQGWSQRRRKRRRKGTNGEDVMEKDKEEKQGER